MVFYKYGSEYSVAADVFRSVILSLQFLAIKFYKSYLSNISTYMVIVHCRSHLSSYTVTEGWTEQYKAMYANFTHQ